MIIVDYKYQNKAKEWNTYQRKFRNTQIREVMGFCYKMAKRVDYVLLDVSVDDGDYETYNYLQRKIDIDKINGWR